MVKIIFTIVFIWIYGNIVTILERLLKSPFRTRELIPNYHDSEFELFVILIVVVTSVVCAVKLEKCLLLRVTKRRIRERLLPNRPYNTITFVLFILCFSVLIEFEKTYVLSQIHTQECGLCYGTPELPSWIEFLFADGTEQMVSVITPNNFCLLGVLSGLSSLIFTEKLDRLLLWAWKKVKYKIM